MSTKIITNYWLIVDTVSAPYAYEFLTKNFSVSWSQPLFKGCDFEYLIEQSPLVLNLGESKDCLDIWEKVPELASCSVFFTLGAQIDEVHFIKHLQALLRLNLNQHAVLFRFYSNEFWMKVGDALSDQHINILLGKAEAIIWANNASNIFRRENADIEHWPSAYQLNSPLFNEWL